MRGNTRNRKALVGAALLCAALASACSLGFREPEVRLDSVRLAGLGLNGGTLVASVMVTNPNRFDLRTEAMAYDLDLGDPAESNRTWTRLAQGTIDREYHIASHDSTVIEIPLEFSYNGVSSAIRTILFRGTFDYRFGGDITLTSPVSRRVPFRRTGKVSLMTSN